jgi:hypothetical protein
MMKNKRLILILLLSLTGCGPAFNELDLSSVGVRNDVDLFKVSVNESLLSADQVLASMTEVTGVPADGAILNEWSNNSRTALASNHKVVNISGPILMAAANLGSRFCDKTLENEINVEAGKRRLYKAINFSQSLLLLSDENFTAVVQNMGLKLWGRAVNDSELQLFKTFREGFIEELTAAEKGQAGKTRDMMLGVCTAMLASYEALSL